MQQNDVSKGWLDLKANVIKMLVRSPKHLTTKSLGGWQKWWNNY